MRVASLASVPALLRDLGTDPVPLLKKVGLELQTFEEPEDQISLVTAGRLMEACAQETRCPHFGLLVGERGGLDSLGPLGELMRRSPTVDAALRSLTLHMHLRTRGGVPTRTVEGEWATLGYAFYQRGMPGVAHAYDVAIAIACNVMRGLCGSHWRPVEVQLSRVRPRESGPYRRFFRAPLQFDADRTALVFARHWLDQPLPAADPDLYQLLNRQLTEREALNVEDLTEQVRRALRTMLVTGRGKEQDVAELFSIHPRTLHRRLEARGRTLRDLVDEGRCEIACQLLRDTNMSVGEIAKVLNYADATALSRAFGRWMSMPPSAWRTRTRTAEAKCGSALRRKKKR